MLTPLDVQKKVFSKSLRGYSEREVQTYLSEISATLEKHINDNADLKERSKRAFDEVGKYKNIESTLSETLIVAKKAAEDLLANAKREAEQIVTQAKMQARATEEQTKRDLSFMNEKRMMMEKDLESFRLRMEALLRAQLEVVSHYKSDAIDQGLHQNKVEAQLQAHLQGQIQPQLIKE